MKDRERKTLMDWLTTKENTMNYEQLLQKTASIKKIDGIMEHKLLWLSSSQLVDRVDCQDVLVLGTRVAISDTARDLGVVIDRELSLAAHVTAVCRSGYNQLRQLRPVVRSLSVNATKTLVQAFISCRLDYCNSLLFGISDGLLRRLQSVQNAAARLVTGARRCDHITPVLWQLHWLPVRQRVVFNIAGLVYISRLVDWLPRTSQTVAFCRTLAVAHCGPIPMTRGSCLCHEHITNSVIVVSRPPVLDCGTTFHLDSGGRDLPSTLSDNL